MELISIPNVNIKPTSSFWHEIITKNTEKRFNANYLGLETLKARGALYEAHTAVW